MQTKKEIQTKYLYQNKFQEHAEWLFEQNLSPELKKKIQTIYCQIKIPHYKPNIYAKSNLRKHYFNNTTFKCPTTLHKNRENITIKICCISPQYKWAEPIT